MVGVVSSSQINNPGTGPLKRPAGPRVMGNMKAKIIGLCAALAGLAALSGCSTISGRIAANPEAFAQLPPDQQALVRNGQIAIGFTSADVRMALGNPTRISTRTDKNGQVEIWHYEDPAYYDYGPYWGWGGWGRGWGPGFGAWGGWYGPGVWDYPMYPYPVRGPDRMRVTFQNDRVIRIEQERS